MSAYNHVTLVGNLAKDPERTMVGKKAKGTFTLAVERYMGKDIEAEVDFFNIVTWGKLAEIATEYLKQGSKVLIDGRIQVSKINGQWLTEVITENLKFLKKAEEITNE